MRFMARHCRRGGCRRRRATAAVEFAVVLPLLITILFGIIEFGWTLMVRQVVTNAAREGTRVAAMQAPPKYCNQDINDAVNNALATINGLHATPGTEIAITHYTQTDPSESVQVSIPYSRVSLVGSFFGFGGTMRSTSLMRKEGWDASLELPTEDCGG